jgi:hypothetical protein
MACGSRGQALCHSTWILVDANIVVANS